MQKKTKWTAPSSSSSCVSKICFSRSLDFTVAATSEGSRQKESLMAFRTVNSRLPHSSSPHCLSRCNFSFTIVTEMNSRAVVRFWGHVWGNPEWFHLSNTKLVNPTQNDLCSFVFVKEFDGKEEKKMLKLPLTALWRTNAFLHVLTFTSRTIKADEN